MVVRQEIQYIILHEQLLRAKQYPLKSEYQNLNVCVSIFVKAVSLKLSFHKKLLHSQKVQ